MSPQLSKIGEQLRQILHDAVAKSTDLSIDPALINTLLVEILSILPADEEPWQKELAIIIQPAVDEFKTQPQNWHSVIKFTATRLHAIYSVPEHPRASKNNSEAQENKTITSPVYFQLAERLLLGLMNQAKESDRIEFFSKIQDWAILRIINSSVIKQLQINAYELAALTGVAIGCIGDLQGNRILQEILNAITENPLPAREILEKWISNSHFTDLEPNSIALLVRGVVLGAGTSGDEVIAWRERVIENIDRRNEERWWQTATHLLGAAWPPNTNIRVRHNALLERVKRHPERLLSIGLRTIAGDAHEFPSETLQTALKLLELGPSSADKENQTNWCLSLAQIIEIIFEKESRFSQLSLDQLDRALDHVVHVPKQTSPDPLDTIFEKLAAINEARASALMARWLLIHADQLIEAGETLREAFPLLDSNVRRRWLILFMVSTNPVLRVIGVRLWHRKESIPDQALENLEIDKIRGLLFQLAGSGIIGEKWVTLAGEIGRCRPDALDSVLEVLLDAAVPDYPMTCRKMAEQLWKQSDKPALISASEKVLQAIEQQQQRWNQRGQIPEFSATYENYSIRLEIEQRRMDDHMRNYERSGQSVAALIATKQNMAYGARSIISFGAGRETIIETKQVQSDMYETSLIAIIDIIAAANQCSHYLDLATKLLN